MPVVRIRVRLRGTFTEIDTRALLDEARYGAAEIEDLIAGAAQQT